MFRVAFVAPTGEAFIKSMMQKDEMFCCGKHLHR